MAVATLIAVAGCNTDATAPKPNLDPWGPGCGTNGTQLRTATPPKTTDNADVSLSVMPPGVPQRLEQVIVYGNPVQRPYRGYGSNSSYGGMTITFTYQRDALDECSFGDGRTAIPVGPVVDDTLETPMEKPEDVSDDEWSSIPPRVKRQLREAAWRLADFWVPNDIPGIGQFVLETRRAMIFSALLKRFAQSEQQLPDRQTQTRLWVSAQFNSTSLSRSETYRLDAFLLGCATASQFRGLNSWNPEQAESYASRVVAGWAADQTEAGDLRYLEPQMSHLGALGAAAGRNGDSCAQTAQNHFRQVPNDLFDPGRFGGGGTQF